MKTIRYGYVLVVALMLILLIACGKKDPNYEIRNDFDSASLLQLNENTSVDEITSNIGLIMKFKDHQITWKSDKSQAMIDGNIVIITRTLVDISVELEASITVNGEKMTRKFTITIKKEDENSMDLRKGTFDRLYPEYYEKGVPLIDDAHVIYINWDGFAKYYLDEFFATEEGKNSTLYKLKSEGVYFENLRNTFPSITNPCQNQILSGGTSLITGNIYRYYDKATDNVIQQQRENKALILPQVTVEEGLSTVSVRMYLAEPYLTSTDKNKLYVTEDSTNPKVIARGKSGDHFDRMEQAIKMIKGEPVLVGGQTFVFDEMPRLTIIYADDMDAVGHNENSHYGYPIAKTEADRRKNIQTLLKEMDEKLGELIEAAKARGIYETLTFFLTTDHGMSPYGSRGVDDTMDYGISKLYELIEDVSEYNKNYVLERVQPGYKPQKRTNIVGVCANLNMYMTFKNGVTDSELDNFKAYLETLPYVYEVYTRNDLINEYMDIKDVDILVVPALHYSFSNTSPIFTISVRGQHDSSLPESNCVPGFIWGKGIKVNYQYSEVAYNYDFGITMAAVLGVDLPEANGIVLDIFERSE
ncbi:MAG: alkaline phosphatase family protein [Acholeplasmatales bacterium]